MNNIEHPYSFFLFFSFLFFLIILITAERRSSLAHSSLSAETLCLRPTLILRQKAAGEVATATDEAKLKVELMKKESDARIAAVTAS